MRQLYVYIMCNSSRTLYVGVTNNIERRVLEHRSGTGEGKFTSRYRIRRLVYYEQLGPPIAAITREKQIKGWDRAKRIALITSLNPAWNDLADGWFKFPFGTPVEVKRSG
jgi:putative endonuclease